MNSLIKRLRTHRLHYGILISISVVAALLRFQLLTTHALFFSDMGRDFLVAYQALESNTLPLVGIATSHPYLHQGPLSLWLTMLIFSVTDNSSTAVVTVFACIGFLTVVALYELIVTTVSNRAALIATACIAVSPLAIAQSRMAYHTNPIAVFMVGYLWALFHLWQQFSVKWLCISLCFLILLVQSELSNIPLFFLIPYIFWRTHQKLNGKTVRIFAIATVSILLIGFLPQILSELQGTTAQIAGTFTTAQNKLLNLEVFPERKNFIWGQNSLLYYIRYSIGLDLITQLIGGFLLTLSSLIAFRLIKAKQLPVTVELALVSLCILLLSFGLIRGVSEAYMPPVFICLAVILSLLAYTQKRALRALSYSLVALLAVANTVGTIRSEFYTSTTAELRYDAIGEQRAIAAAIVQHAQGSTMQLATSPSILSAAPTYLDGIRFFLEKDGEQVKSETSSLHRSYLVLPITDDQPVGTFSIQKLRTKQLLLLPARTGAQ